MAEENYGSWGLYNMDERSAITLVDRVTPYRNLIKDRSNSKYPAADIEMFFRMIGLALSDYYAAFKISTDDQFNFSPYYPQDLKEEHIGEVFNFLTYKLLQRRPPVSKNSGKPRIAPYQFDEGMDSEYAGYQMQRDIWVRDNIVQFDIFSTSYPLAEDFAIWFETYFIPMYAGNFQAYGMKGPYFLRREEDKTDTIIGKLVYTRSLVYMVQTQTVRVKVAKTIDSIRHVYEL